ncbi:uncharacterized protein MELLADRAFT_123836 [Melampsora larici-populina 98AG31]|uniref:Secreted protein n=1 Tax=Melampsora larici-populina (strain 98AG31 / pathotype 3-4-7) TaxID=747676 RepID=F4R519_MELLP|nr:uncharacterized protein MELLADRAFT_123836 [Melampsora larici-populina 98AG31]EGG12351.1 secreted protein [Melampsora larici-populina 98AG31]
MSLKNYLALLVICTAISIFQVNAKTGVVHCPGGYSKGGGGATCYESPDENGITHACPSDKCGHDGKTWVWMHGCVHYPDGTAIGSEQCTQYTFLRDNLYVCTTIHGKTYQCPHKLSDPSISCTDCFY